MDKNEIFKQVSRRIDGATKGDVQTVLEVYVDWVKETLQANPDERIPLPGLGKFSVKHVEPRTGTNNLTGKKFNTPAKDLLKFSPLPGTKEL